VTNRSGVIAAGLKRLAAQVPPQRQNQIRYYGLLAAQAHDRDRLLALVAHAADADRHDDGGGGDDGEPPSVAVADPPDPSASPPVGVASPPVGVASPPVGVVGHRVRWAQLLARVFGHQVLVCSHCGGPRTIIAAITDCDVAASILVHLGLPTDAPELAPARAPPQTELLSDDEPVA